MIQKLRGSVTARIEAVYPRIFFSESASIRGDGRTSGPSSASTHFVLNGNPLGIQGWKVAHLVAKLRSVKAE